MTTHLTPAAGTAPAPDVIPCASVPSAGNAPVPVVGLLAELDRVSRHRSSLQERLEDVHAARRSTATDEGQTVPRRRCSVCAFFHRNGTGRAEDCTL